MVHALREARRVLVPGGVAIDLRPAIAHRRVKVVRSGQAELIGAMRERFDDAHAANRAVAKMVGPGGGSRSTPPLQFKGRQRVDCERVMDGPDDLREWVADFMSRDDSLPPHDWLIERVERALGTRRRSKGSVVVSGPLELRVLKKP